jgi:predicted Holliday junction resolvase-like endonuclease
MIISPLVVAWICVILMVLMALCTTILLSKVKELIRKVKELTRALGSRTTLLSTQDTLINEYMNRYTAQRIQLRRVSEELNVQYNLNRSLREERRISITQTHVIIPIDRKPHIYDYVDDYVD